LDYSIQMILKFNRIIPFLYWIIFYKNKIFYIIILFNLCWTDTLLEERGKDEF
jgi:hypothetical protein